MELTPQKDFTGLWANAPRLGYALSSGASREGQDMDIIILVLVVLAKLGRYAGWALLICDLLRKAGKM